MKDLGRPKPPAQPRAIEIDRRQLLAGTTALGLSSGLGLSLFSTPSQAETPKRGGILRLGIADGSTSDTLDPARTDTSQQTNLNYTIRDRLTEIDESNKLAPGLAESWESTPDAKKWILKLRRGVEFHNGKSLDASDVVATINHHIQEDSVSGAKALFSSIESLKADNQETVIVELSAGSADFPYFLADFHMGIIPADSEGKVDTSGVGTGAYVVESYEPGVRANLDRFPNYWKENSAYFDRVESLVIKDPAARSNALITDEVDAIDDLEPKTVDRLAEVSGIEVDEVASGSHVVMSMHTDTAPFDNNDVRMALKLALDRENLLSTILRGHGTLGNDHPIAPTMPFFANLPQRHYDPDKARFHLKKAGFDSLKVQISAAEVWAGAIDAATLFREHAAKAGIDLEVVRVPTDGFWTEIWLKKPFLVSWWAPRPTPDVIFSIAYSRDAEWNETRFDHDQFNKFLVAARAELDNTKRGEMYAEMQRTVRDEGGTIVPFFRNFLFARRSRLQHGPSIAGNWQLDGHKAAERWWFA